MRPCHAGEPRATGCCACPCTRGTGPAPGGGNGPRSHAHATGTHALTPSPAPGGAGPRPGTRAAGWTAAGGPEHGGRTSSRALAYRYWLTTGQRPASKVAEGDGLEGCRYRLMRGPGRSPVLSEYRVLSTYQVVARARARAPCVQGRKGCAVTGETPTVTLPRGSSVSAFGPARSPLPSTM